MKRVAVFVSGGGTNLQALIDAKASGGMPHVSLVLVVASRPKIQAIERAQSAGIPCKVVSRRDFADDDMFDQALTTLLLEYMVDVVVLAGYLTILGKRLIDTYEGRMINVHPSLIPSFCGKGWYGLKVHRAVLERGVRVTGATVHLVNGIPDGGRILAQKAVEVRDGDTPETLQKRVMVQAEQVLLPKEMERLCQKISTMDEADDEKKY